MRADGTSLGYVGKLGWVRQQRRRQASRKGEALWTRARLTWNRVYQGECLLLKLLNSPAKPIPAYVHIRRSVTQLFQLFRYSTISLFHSWTNSCIPTHASGSLDNLPFSTIKQKPWYFHPSKLYLQPILLHRKGSITTPNAIPFPSIHSCTHKPNLFELKNKRSANSLLLEAITTQANWSLYICSLLDRDAYANLLKQVAARFNDIENQSIRSTRRKL